MFDDFANDIHALSTVSANHNAGRRYFSQENTILSLLRKQVTGETAEKFKFYSKVAPRVAGPTRRR
jgi:hypothetical protein